MYLARGVLQCFQVSKELFAQANCWDSVIFAPRSPAFYDDRGAVSGNELCGAPENVQLVALDVYFNEGYLGRVRGKEAIEGGSFYGHLRASGVDSGREGFDAISAAVWRTEKVGGRFFFGGKAAAAGIYIGEVAQGEICAKVVKDAGVWLKSKDAGKCPGEGHCPGAAMGPDV